MSAALRKRRSDKPGEGIYEPNMTPLIDVSLVLVVILMVATPMAFQSGIAVSAAASSGRAQVKERDVRVEITVGADGWMTVNRERVPRASLAARLGPLLEGGSPRVVVVRCDDAVPHGEFVWVLDEARALGATRVAVVGS